MAPLCSTRLEKVESNDGWLERVGGALLCLFLKEVGNTEKTRCFLVQGMYWGHRSWYRGL